MCMVAGREEAVDTALSLQPKRATLISETRALQSQVYIYSTAASVEYERFYSLCVKLEHSYSSFTRRSDPSHSSTRALALERPIRLLALSARALALETTRAHEPSNSHDERYLLTSFFYTSDRNKTMNNSLRARCVPHPVDVAPGLR